MNDFFYEQILPLELDFKKRLLRLIIIVIVTIPFLFLLLIQALFGMVIYFLVIILVFRYLLPRFNMEYEYSLTNNLLQIAVIYNKESRKDKFSLDLSSVEIIAPAHSPRLHFYQQAKCLSFVSKNSLETYSIIYKKEDQFYNIQIQPDNKMKDYIKNRVLSKMYFD